MHPLRFDAMTRLLATGSSRRALALLAAGLGVLSTQTLPTSAKKNKKPKPNEFGCLNVGQKCRGNDSKCCSGLCEGKKPKHGKKDKSRCVGHDESTCLAGQQTECSESQGAQCTTSAGTHGGCQTTTGNAAYCADLGARKCVVCQRDVDCQALCGPQAACIQCLGCSTSGGTACVGPQNIPTCRVAV
jgi:hypothetical protein